MRCLLPRSLLCHGLFEGSVKQKESIMNGTASHVCSYSWSGQRKLPSYIGKLVFPEKFMASLRTIAMQEEDIYRVSSLLEEVSMSLEYLRTTLIARILYCLNFYDSILSRLYYREDFYGDHFLVGDLETVYVYNMSITYVAE